MPRIQYLADKRFRRDSLAIINLADEICTSFAAQGYDLTLRQLYYQFISRDAFPNTEQSYNRLGKLISDARLQGLIDWNHLEDRGRNAHGVGWHTHEIPSFESIVRQARWNYSHDLWTDQPRRVEVWVEKQALEQVVQRAAGRTRTASFACKGYVSQSEMWRAGQRMREIIDGGQEPLILHLGDHDPSGIDMTRDIRERLSLFAEEDIEVKRIALNMDQIRRYAPPPNPAKVTDSRFESYRAVYGDESWELDALRPDVLAALIEDEIELVLDRKRFTQEYNAEVSGRKRFEAIADRWDEIVEFLEENPA